MLNKATENKKIINKNLYPLVIVKQSQKALAIIKKKKNALIVIEQQKKKNSFSWKVDLGRKIITISVFAFVSAILLLYVEFLVVIYIY